MHKRLYKSSTNRVFSGVLGGLGEYFEIDPVLFRLIFLLITIFTGFVPGFLAYLFASAIVPKRPHHEHQEKAPSEAK